MRVPAGPYREAIVTALREAGATVLVARGPDDPTGDLLVPSDAATDLDACFAAAGPLDAVIVHPSAVPTGGERPARDLGLLLRRSQDRLTRILEDDALWDDTLEHGLIGPWRWLHATLRHTPAGEARTVTLLIPGAHRPEALFPGEAATRDALSALVITTAVQTHATRVRINGILISPATYADDLARLCVSTASEGASGLSGQLLTARARLPG